MRTIVPKKSGYSLIEFAFALLAVGMLITPATMAYRNYIAKNDLDSTKSTIDQITIALGNYRTIHNRYPCPAPLTAVPGDAAYGREACAPGTPGIITAPSVRPVVSAVTIGAIPFKALNLQEQDSYDPYLHRYTYAVTKSLTDDDTFNMNNGSVDVVDRSGDSLLNPPGSLHFIVLSTGSESEGAYTRAGIQTGVCPAGRIDSENCDGDSIFLSTTEENTFDDTLSNFTIAPLSEWQISETDATAIHPKVATKLAMGVEDGDSLAALPSLVALNSSNEMGNISVGGNKIISDSICTEDTVIGDPPLCFSSKKIGGQVAAGETFTCPPGQFLIGINAGVARCSEEIYISCPDTYIITGINVDGTLACNGPPPPPCPVAPVTTSCGESRTLPATPSDQFASVYSGQCYKFARPFPCNPVIGPDGKSRCTFWNSVKATLRTLPTLAQKQAYIDSTLNSAPRIQEDCGPAANTALVRDSYMCVEGAWEGGNATPTPKTSHERYGKNNGGIYPVIAGSDNFPLPSTVTGVWPAEVGGPAYGLLTDPGHSDDAHDCWCREDYRVAETTCRFGYTGTGTVVQRYTCPQTKNGNWQAVMVDNFGAGSNCGCKTSDKVEFIECAAHFGVPAGSLVGKVKKTSHYECVAGASTLIGTPVVDATACKCPPNVPQIVATDCPAGTTNSFTDPDTGTSYTGLESLTKQTWTCPNGVNVPNQNASGAGFWEPATPVAGIPACTCDADFKVPETTPCPPDAGGLARSGFQHWLKPWICATSTTDEDPNHWTLDTTKDNSCSSCRWQPLTGSVSADISGPTPSPEKNTNCSCGTPNQTCFATKTVNTFNSLGPCGCVP